MIRKIAALFLLAAATLACSGSASAEVDSWQEQVLNGNQPYCIGDPFSGGPGTDLNMHTCDGGANSQDWSTVVISSGPYAGREHIINGATGLCANIPNGGQDNIRMDVISCNDTYLGEAFLPDTSFTGGAYPWLWYDETFNGPTGYECVTDDNLDLYDGAWVVSQPCVSAPSGTEYKAQSWRYLNG